MATQLRSFCSAIGLHEDLILDVCELEALGLGLAATLSDMRRDGLPPDLQKQDFLRLVARIESVLAYLERALPGACTRPRGIRVVGGETDGLCSEGGVTRRRKNSP